MSLSACGDGASDAGDGDETTTSEETAAEGEETPAEEETEPPAEEESEAPEGDTQDVFDVGLGDCISNFNAEEQVSELTVIACEDEHDQEVFAVFEVPEGDGSFPGAEAFQTQVESDCISEFATFVGMDYNESVLEIRWLEPTEESWAEGDRELVCTVLDPSGPVSGTLEGANR
nr:septum formation family protein [Jiangella mangrovi]